MSYPIEAVEALSLALKADTFDPAIVLEHAKTIVNAGNDVQAPVFVRDTLGACIQRVLEGCEIQMLERHVSSSETEEPPDLKLRDELVGNVRLLIGYFT